MVHPSVFTCDLHCNTNRLKSPRSKSFCASMVSQSRLYSPYSRNCSQQSVFFRVHPLSVCGLTFTCMRGSVIFSNMLDFAVNVWTTCVACPLAAFGGSISPCYRQMLLFTRRYGTSPVFVAMNIITISTIVYKFDK